MDFQDSYDKVAHDYAEEFSDELAKKPFDRKMLELLIEKVDDLGVICDMGCGPGQIAAFLDSRDAKACGIDNSAGMIAEAKLRHPDLAFQRGDMLELREVADGSFGGIAAFYSIIHIPRESVVNALRELKRVLRSKGVLLLTFHIGDETIHRDEWWGKEVSLDFIFFQIEEMRGYLQEAGFTVEEIIERYPYPEIEYQSHRAYIFARSM